MSEKQGQTIKSELRKDAGWLLSVSPLIDTKPKGRIISEERRPSPTSESNDDVGHLWLVNLLTLGVSPYILVKEDEDGVTFMGIG